MAKDKGTSEQFKALMAALDVQLTMAEASGRDPEDGSWDSVASSPKTQFRSAIILSIELAVEAKA